MSLIVHDLPRLAWAQFWQVTLVASVGLLVTRILFRQRPQLAYAILMIVLIKSLTPPVWHSPLGLFSINWQVWGDSQRAVLPSSVASNEHHRLTNPATPSPNAIGSAGTAESREIAPTSDPLWSRFSPSDLLVWIWVTSAALAGAFLAIQYHRNRRAILRTTSLASCELQDRSKKIAESIGYRASVSVLVSSHPQGPFSIGIFRPCIVLPSELVAKTPAASLDLVLTHELLHIRRRDAVVALAQLFAHAIWWFHPLVVLTNRRLTLCRELCCDYELLARTRCAPADYAQTLLDVLKLNRSLPAMMVGSGIRPVEVTKRRLEVIMRTTNPKLKSSWLSWAILLIGLVLLGPGAVQTSSPHSKLAAAETASNTLSGRILASVFRKNDAGNPPYLREVISIDPNTGQWRKVVDEGIFLRVSPDRSQLAYITTPGPINFSDQSNITSELWMCNLEGDLNPRRIWQHKKIGTIAWVADGRSLYAVEGRFIEDEERWRHANWQVSLDGEARELGIPQTDAIEDASRTSDLVVTVSNRHLPFDRGSQLYTMKPDGSEQRRITRDGLNVHARLAPDGQTIAYLHAEKAGTDIRVSSTNGTDERVVYRSEANTMLGNGACWSPDGRYLAMALFEARDGATGVSDDVPPELRNCRLLITSADGQFRTEVVPADLHVLEIGFLDWH